MKYASEFNEITQTVKDNDGLRSRIIDLVASEPILGKVIEGEGRIEELRTILSSFFIGDHDINDAINEVELRLPRNYSQHENNIAIHELKYRLSFCRTMSIVVYQPRLAGYKDLSFIRAS